MIICPDKVTSTVHQQPFHILRLSPTCSATSRYFHLPPTLQESHYDDNVSLDTANINVIIISTPDFRMWQHFSGNWTTPLLQKLANVLEVLVTQCYKHIIHMSEPVHSFTIKDDDEDRTHHSYGQS